MTQAIDVHPCDECGNDRCEKLLIFEGDEEHQTTCCSCRNLLEAEMCDECYNDYWADSDPEYDHQLAEFEKNRY